MFDRSESGWPSSCGRRPSCSKPDSLQFHFSLLFVDSLNPCDLPWPHAGFRPRPQSLRVLSSSRAGGLAPWESSGAVGLLVARLLVARLLVASLRWRDCGGKARTSRTASAFPESWWVFMSESANIALILRFPGMDTAEPSSRYPQITPPSSVVRGYHGRPKRAGENQKEKKKNAVGEALGNGTAR
jgi:hypothetical protein